MTSRRALLFVVHAAGVAALIAPLFAGADPRRSSGTPHAGDAPLLLALLVPILLAVAVGEVAGKRIDSKDIALMGVLCGLNAALRLPGGFAGASLVFFLPIVCGAVYGSTFGFLVGALSFAVSGFITAGIGPWLPFQMFAAGWVGACAGLLRPYVSRARPVWGIVALCAYGYLAGFAFGAVTDLWFWPFYAAGDASIAWHAGMGFVPALRAFKAFYLATSLAWDAGRAVANVVLLAFLAGPAMRLLRRRRDQMLIIEPWPSKT